MCVYVLCTHYVCVPRPSADSAVCVQARNRICSKINLCICSSVYKFNIDELLLKLLAKRGSLTYFMYLPVQASRACQRQNRLALFTQNRTQRACTERSCLSRPNWQVTNPSVLHAIGQSLLSSPGTPLENKSHNLIDIL